LKQKHLKELIIADDGSCDRTDSIIKDFMRNTDLIKYIKLPDRLGVAAARNAGIKEASGEYILFGEDDILFCDDYSAQLLKCINHNGASLISGRIIYMNKGEDTAQALKRADSYTGPLVDGRLLFLYAWKKLSQDTEMPFTQGCFMARREVFQGCKFDENYGGNGWREETDFQVEAAKLGHKIYLCPHTVCFHLPREKDDRGGQWSMNIFTFSLWAIRNNHYFLNKHYDFLKEAMDIPYTKNQLMFFAFLNSVTSIVNYFLYKLKLK
jgi:GT2 family glycosyltransferase